jgi:hypothetical protein
MQDVLDPEVNELFHDLTDHCREYPRANLSAGLVMGRVTNLIDLAEIVGVIKTLTQTETCYLPSLCGRVDPDLNPEGGWCWIHQIIEDKKREFFELTDRKWPES